jgi:hypothetical protein
VSSLALKLSVSTISQKQSWGSRIVPLPFLRYPPRMAYPVATALCSIPGYSILPSVYCVASTLRSMQSGFEADCKILAPPMRTHVRGRPRRSEKLLGAAGRGVLSPLRSPIGFQRFSLPEIPLPHPLGSPPNFGRHIVAAPLTRMLQSAGTG